MRILFLSLVLAAAAVQAHAIERIYAETVTCEQIQAALEQEGAAIIYYPSRSIPGLNLFDRFALTATQCGSTAQIAPFAVKTLDSNACKVPICREQRNGGSN